MIVLVIYVRYICFTCRRIKALREEIAAVQQSREKADKQARSIAKNDDQEKLQIRFYQKKAKEEEERCKALEKRIQQHPMAASMLKCVAGH